jgi:chromosome partitioning protein
VLVIDLDDQANSSLYLGVNKADELDNANTLEEFDDLLKSFEERKEVIDFLNLDFYRPTNYREYIQSSVFNQNLYLYQGKIDVLPSSYKTRDDKLPPTFAPAKQLNKALQKSGISGDYDYVVIDTPPSSTMIANNGLCAAQYVLLPTQMEYFSVYGIRSVVRRITNELQDEMGKERGNILGIVPIMTQGTKLNQLTKKLLEKYLPDVQVLPEIKRTVKWADASQERLPISILAERDPQAREAATTAYKLTDSLVNIMNKIETSERME